MLGRIARFPCYCLGQLVILWVVVFGGAEARQILEYVGRRTWLELFFFQRLLRINAHVPWPCHWSSKVTGVGNIELNGFPPFPGLGVGQYIQARSGIRFGRNVRIAPGVKIISSGHDPLDYDSHLSSEPVVIGDNCWIGANAVILPGVRLGRHVVVGAGSVVTRSFDEGDVMIAGVPAVVKKRLEPYLHGASDLGATSGERE